MVCEQDVERTCLRRESRNKILRIPAKKAGRKVSGQKAHLVIWMPREGQMMRERRRAVQATVSSREKSRFQVRDPLIRLQNLRGLFRLKLLQKPE